MKRKLCIDVAVKDWSSERGNELLHATGDRNCWRGMTVKMLNAQDM